MFDYWCFTWLFRYGKLVFYLLTYVGMHYFMKVGLLLPEEGNKYIQHFTSTLVVTLHPRPLHSTDRAGVEPH